FNGWMQGGSGAWSVQNGEAVQTVNTTDFAYAFNPTVTATDYRIVGSMRITDATHTSTALELAARVHASGTQYHCNWDALHGEFSLMWTMTSAVNGFFAQTFIDTSQIPGYDAHAAFVMELQVHGARIDCCVHGVPGAAGTANDTRFATGAPGM